jgi:hypothetical protein
LDEGRAGIGLNVVKDAGLNFGQIPEGLSFITFYQDDGLGWEPCVGRRGKCLALCLRRYDIDHGGLFRLQS